MTIIKFSVRSGRIFYTGNVMYADDLVELFGVDAIRYFVLHETPFENDGTITWDLITERVNTDLANILGNLVNRTIAMTNRYFGGVVEDTGTQADPDAEFKDTILSCVVKVQEKMDVLRVADAISAIFEIFRRCNKYIDETEPWKLAKEPESAARLKTVLYNLVEGIVIGASLLKSFMPSTSEKILGQLNAEHRSLESMTEFGIYPSGNKVTDTPEILFARLDPEAITAKVEEIQKKYAAPERPKLEHKETISIDDFGKTELRVCEVLDCEKVPKADKLLKLTLFDGERERIIVSGIAKQYSPEDMKGKKVVCVVNLAPHSFRGIESEGMLLASETDGVPRVVFVDADVPAGSEIH